MLKVFEIIEELISTSSSNEKLVILKKYKNEKDFLKVMQFVYSPYIKSNIGRNKLIANQHDNSFDSIELTWDRLINVFSNSTGRLAEVSFAWYCINCIPEEYKDLMGAIITRTLTIGVTVTSLNKAYGKDFIPKGGCMLGTLQKDVAAKYNVGNFIVTEKLDGQRKLVVKDDASTEIFSGRNWMLDNNYSDIHEAYEKLPKGYVYDGEMLAVGTFKNSIARRQATSSICSRKGPKVGVEHAIFDIIPLEDFKTGICKVPSIVRKFWVAVLFNDQDSIDMIDTMASILGIKLTVPHEFTIVNIKEPLLKPVEVLGQIFGKITEQDILQYVTPIWQRGDEGIMLNEIMAPYEIKRSKALLKVKNTEEYDLKIVGWEYGTTGTSNENICGSLIVSYKGYNVNVGSGLTNEQRWNISRHENDWIGKICTVQCFGESTNQSGGISLNSPVFICIREDKNEADF